MNPVMQVLVAAVIAAALFGAGVGFGVWYFGDALEVRALTALIERPFENRYLEQKAKYESEQAARAQDREKLQHTITGLQATRQDLVDTIDGHDLAIADREQAHGRSVQLAVQREAVLEAEILALAPQAADQVAALSRLHAGVVRGFQVRVADLSSAIEERDDLLAILRSALADKDALIGNLRLSYESSESRRKEIEGRRWRLGPGIAVGNRIDATRRGQFDPAALVGISLVFG